MPYRPVVKLLEKLEQSGLPKELIKKPNVDSVALNGVGAYIPPIRKITIRYAPYSMHSGGTSRGVSSWILNNLKPFAAARPYVVFRVEQDFRRQPVAIAEYTNGALKTMELKRLAGDDITQKLTHACHSSGQPDQKYKRRRVVRPRIRDVVGGVWDPFHNPTFRP
ncbi:39S ribosomal protein L51, mitochondrial [Borealophlyctis nickersoniae]|nr:39S ribosomal protein L51, mitochondrial [Borealophlyctis nickersoniae]